MIPFSFFIHFRRTFREDMRFFWKPLGWLPESFYVKLFAHLNHRSYRWSTVQLKKEQKAGKNIDDSNDDQRIQNIQEWTLN